MTAWWVDHGAEIASRALAVMRINDPADPDLERVKSAARSAGQLIDARLDRCTPLPVVTPDSILSAAVEVTIELYRRKDAPFGSVGGWADGVSPTPIFPDPLGGVMPMLAPYREGLGIA